jgi:GWxTD domain-containing protein
MILNDPETAIAMLKYIATNKEIESLKNADSAEARLEIWNQMWLSRDPTEGTLENEAKKDYYRRVEFAVQNFSIMRKPGWRTDRGMIYIMYGEPDQIEDFPFELNAKAYQIWYYYRSSDKLREFLFVDEWGNNDYVLQYPYDGVRN